MEIILGKSAGFCFGVSNAVKKTKEQIEKEKEVFCLGELVHNKQVTECLQEQGVKFIEDIEQARKKIIIRAHGIPKQIYSKAKKLKLEVIDLTCPKVLKIHKLAEEYSKKSYFIFLIGQKCHPEIIGTISFCGKNSYIIEESKDISDAINELRNSNIKNLLIISQTTFSIKKFEGLVNEIKDKIQENINIEIKKTICNATEIRQKETESIAKQVELMIIIGGKHSSNTQKIYEISQKNCKTILIENEKELIEIKPIKNISKIGVMAGASTPQESINNTIEIIKNIW